MTLLMSEKPIKTHQKCPDCNHNGCLTVWSSGAYCNSCHLYTGLVPKEVKLEDKIVGYRGIKERVAKKYGVLTGFNDKGEEVRRSYPYPKQFKHRYLPKDFTKNMGFKADCLFGMDKFNAGSSKAITIVEGEDDAPSGYQMLGETYPVVALPGAGVSHALLQNCHKWLDAFSEIVVCTDADDAGDSAASKIASAFPNKVSRVSLTKHNDPNDFLQAGDSKAFLFSFHNREKYTPAGVYNTATQFKTIVREEVTSDYVPTPCSTLNDKIKGLMQGHLTVITGPEGQGKTEILRWFEHHVWKTTDKTIAVLHMEEGKKTCLMSYLCYELGQNLRDPDNIVPQAEIDVGLEGLSKDGRLFLFDFNMDDDPLHVLDKVRYFKEACGADFIFIDTIQQLAYGNEKDASEERTLSQLAVQLEKLATQLNVGIVLTTHVNDAGQIRSSRMIGKAASVRIDLERDHMNIDPDIANVTHLSISKNRPLAQTGYGGTVKFDPDTFTLKEYHADV